jgi:uncharacterized phage protein (TIGR02220 family)
MAMRTRQIHPRFWISESVASVGFFERLLFQALWGLADREGLLLYRPGEIRPQAFPHDSCVTRDSMVAGIAALEAARLVTIINRKDGTDDPAIWIPKFKEYQWVNKDEAKSKLIQHYFTWNPEQSIWIHTDPRQSSSYTLKLCTPTFNDSITLSPPKAPRKRGGVIAQDVLDTAAEVADYLNEVTGKSLSRDKANDQIIRAIKAGATLEDCKTVIDHCWALWKDDPKMVKYVSKSTPFRASHFDLYLDEARAGPAVKAMTPAQREQAEKDKWFKDFVSDCDKRAEAKAKEDTGNGSGNRSEEPEDRNVVAKIAGLARWT